MNMHGFPKSHRVAKANVAPRLCTGFESVDTAADTGQSLIFHYTQWSDGPELSNTCVWLRGRGCPPLTEEGQVPRGLAVCPALLERGEMCVRS